MAPNCGCRRWAATFLAALPLQDQAKLRALSALFLQRKEFSGAHGLVVTDAMAVAIAAQACLPLLHWGAPDNALAWYDDFVGIVVHPAEALARRKAVDEAGVVHHYHEVLLGEAMEHGPVMLSWPAVDGAGHSHGATSVVIHEFMHKIDMRNGPADGCPPLPARLLGQAGARNAHAAWQAAWQPAYEQFREQVIIAERFRRRALAGRLWRHGAGQFCRGLRGLHFVDRPRFAQEFPTLAPMLQALWGKLPARPHGLTARGQLHQASVRRARRLVFSAPGVATEALPPAPPGNAANA